jgi:large subunit ribosomal protein L5e
MLKKLDMDKTFKGVAEVNGEEFHVEEDEAGDRKPFKCVLDVGITRTTLGNRVFGALKGAVDGGLHVPHTVKRFPGFTKAEGKGAEDKYDAEAHKEKIIAGHVCDYMEAMKENDEEKYKRHFSKYLEAGLDGDALEDMLLKTHKAIRADPTFKGLSRLSKKDGGKKRKLLPPTKVATKSSSYKAKNTRSGQVITTNSGSYSRPIKLSLAQRKDRVAQKWEAFRSKVAAQVGEEEDDE